jgi:hypothetical protein
VVGDLLLSLCRNLQQRKRLLSVAAVVAKAVHAHQGLLLTDTTM